MLEEKIGSNAVDDNANTSDNASTALNNTNPFTNHFVPPTSSPTQTQTINPFGAGQKFATIGRSNPFSSPNKSKNPFLDRLEVPPQPTTAPVPAPGSPMSTGSPNNSPDASLGPNSENDSSTSTLNKIVSHTLSLPSLHSLFSPNNHHTFCYVSYICLKWVQATDPGHSFPVRNSTILGNF